MLETGGEKMARATFAAILAASTSNCTCETCIILKQVAQQIKAEFLAKG
jgi:hypothetical protein